MARATRYEVLFVLYSLQFSLLLIPMVLPLRSITPDRPIHYNETLVSESGKFEAGFFALGNSQSLLYFCIWYKSFRPRTIVWVANRDTPLDNTNTTAIFKLTDKGNPVIIDGSGTTIWYSNASTTTTNAEKPVLLLLDTGNLVVRNGSINGKTLWQSFDYPGDTLLPGMILKVNRASGVYNSLTSWKSTGDPSRGEFSYHLDGHGFPQLFITKGSTLIYRLGSWNGFFFSGVPWETLYSYFTFSFELFEEEVRFGYEPLNSSIVSRYMITSTGSVQRFLWSYQTESWQLFLAGPVDRCDNYNLCGANSNCNVDNTPQCECVTGFAPKSQEKWDLLDYSDGCVRKVRLDCDDRDGFLKYTRMKLPDTSSSWFDKSKDLQECEKQCRKNCSCTAYASLDIRNGGSGCMIWFNNIMDMRKESSVGQEIYIRVAASELGNSKNNNSNKKKLTGVLIGIGILFLVTTIVGYFIYLRRKKLRKSGRDTTINHEDHIDNNDKESIDLPTFDFSTIANATNNFCPSNKLGEGGYGPVYKGALENGGEIAVKRLSLKSGQGPQEFKNEVLLIANLQHRNLVKLLGCCIHNEERILIYEYMPNRSLDNFIFGQTFVLSKSIICSYLDYQIYMLTSRWNFSDQTRSKVLDWNKRLHVISGIARGLLYLHQDSRLRIIHRDLKTSNILLDNDMNPKISDFGLARAFGGDHAEANTVRVVGTHGYMPPEYAVYGSFSVKTDVFSFGVIVLEMVSGRKNREFSDPQHNLNLLGHAWRLWSEDRPVELIDDSLSDSVIDVAEALRCIHIGLLCVQERPDDRPDMSSVVLMLNGERALPNPKQPGFYPHDVVVSSSSKQELSSSTNELSISMLQPR